MGWLAMLDYPYEADFAVPLPAWPVKLACKNFNSVAKNNSTEDYARASYEFLRIFHNSTGRLSTTLPFLPVSRRRRMFGVGGDDPTTLGLEGWYGCLLWYTV
jgi:hypothetical protein